MSNISECGILFDLGKKNQSWSNIPECGIFDHGKVMGRQFNNLLILGIKCHINTATYLLNSIK